MTDVVVGLIQDPEDKMFITREDLVQLKPDPTVGAVLCGMDINLSQ